MSASAIPMLVAAVLLFALFATALAWAELQARRFTTAKIGVRRAGEKRKRAF